MDGRSVRPFRLVLCRHSRLTGTTIFHAPYKDAGLLRSFSFSVYSTHQNFSVPVRSSYSFGRYSDKFLRANLDNISAFISCLPVLNNLAVNPNSPLFHQSFEL